VTRPPACATLRTKPWCAPPEKAQDLKANDRAGALKGAAYHLTPLYDDIRWELLLSPKLQTKDVIEDLIRTARYTTL
jgi:hypothetical protein